MACLRLAFLALLGPAAAAPDPAESAFEDFVKSYGKAYSSAQERRTRFAIFRENFALIQAENAKGHSYALGANIFADQTPEEFQSTHLGLQKGLTPGQLWAGMQPLGRHNYSGAPLPESVDWRAKGAVTPVKNQLQCGSCWAFSAVGALEGAWQIASGRLVSLSEQQLLDCSRRGNHGCQGGEMYNAFSFMEGNVACSEESYPYTSIEDSCREDVCTAAVPKGAVLGYRNVAVDDERALMSALAQQPVSVAIEADQTAFQLYRSGVLSKDCGDSLDHGVVLVGYGLEGGLPYWRLKNSWGTSWGEAGYARLQRGGKGPGECGVKAQPSYPVVKNAPAPPSPPTPPPEMPHYGAPPCRSDETEQRLEGADGVFCAPACAWFGLCPLDVPPGTAAKPDCVLRSQEGRKYCALPCQASGECPHGAKCVRGKARAVCLFAEKGNGTAALSFADAEVLV